MMRSWAALAFLMAIAAVLLNAPDAWAMADDVTLGNFSCNGGKANGQLLLTVASCPKTLSFDTIFSFLICNFEQLTSNIMGHMFCGMIADLTPAVWAAVSLAIAVFGVSFTIGLVPATGQEAMMFIIKLAFITACATNADILIGVCYRFFLTAMSEGSSIMLSAMVPSAKVTDGASLYSQIDAMFKTLLTFATDTVGAVKATDYCKNALFAVIALLFVILPIAAYIALALIARIILTMFRSVFAYIYALIGLTFLMILAPFFISFFLFKISRPMFDRWLSYLVSFTLQVVLLFAFMTFIVILVQGIKQDNMFKELTGIIMHNEQTPTGSSIQVALSYCTLCDFKVVDQSCPAGDTSCAPIFPTKKDANGVTVNNPDFNKGTLRCKEPKVAINPTFASSPDAYKDPNGTPSTGAISNNSQVSALLTLAGYGIIPLLILVMLMDSLLVLLPSIAQKLAGGLGANYAPQLGGGAGGGAGNPMRMPGESYIDNFGSGFERGFGDKTKGDGISNTISGVKEGFSAMITGRTSDGNAVKNSDGSQGGMKNSFARWIRDPSSFGQ